MAPSGIEPATSRPQQTAPPRATKYTTFETWNLVYTEICLSGNLGFQKEWRSIFCNVIVEGASSSGSVGCYINIRRTLHSALQ
jgi:hypothetical protein